MNPEDFFKVGVYANERIQREKLKEEMEKQNKLLEKQIEATKNAERAAREAARVAAKPAKARQQPGGSGVDSVAVEKQLAGLAGQVERLTELLAARPQIPADKGGPCVTCGTPVSFNAQTCPNCHEPDVGNQVREKKAAEVEAVAEAKAAVEAKVAAKANWKVIERAVRKELKKPTDELTKADLEGVTRLILSENKLTEVPKGLEKLTQLKKLHLNGNHLTDVKVLENLTRLTYLDLRNNPDLTKAQIADLQKALSKCNIAHNATK
jgi:hypothetical protein